MRPSWRFALPPSGADDRVREAKVRTALSTIGCGTVKAALNYSALVAELRTGRVDAAWAPPLVCAQLEAAGGRVLLRAVRDGASAYRSVLFARADRGLTLATLSGTRAAWLDRQSMSGYVLPRNLLRAQGLDPDVLFSQQRFLGSFRICVEAVLEGRVDVSACYASATAVKPERWGFTEIAGARAGELAVLGGSMDCPNDAIVLSPRLPVEEAADLEQAFEQLLHAGAPAKALAQALEVDDFDVPSPGSYLPLASGLTG